MDFIPPSPLISLSPLIPIYRIFIKSDMSLVSFLSKPVSGMEDDDGDPV